VVSAEAGEFKDYFAEAGLAGKLVSSKGMYKKNHDSKRDLRAPPRGIENIANMSAENNKTKRERERERETSRRKDVNM